MARSDAENQAITRKVSKLRAEGFGDRQAKAIAFRMFRDGELDAQIRRAKSSAKKRPSKTVLKAMKAAASLYATKRATKSRKRSKSRRK